MSLLRSILASSALIIIMSCKIHNTIIDLGHQTYFETLNSANTSSIQGDTVVCTQNKLHIGQEIQRTRVRKKVIHLRKWYTALVEYEDEIDV